MITLPGAAPDRGTSWCQASSPTPAAFCLTEAQPRDLRTPTRPAENGFFISGTFRAYFLLTQQPGSREAAQGREPVEGGRREGGTRGRRPRSTAQNPHVTREDRPAPPGPPVRGTEGPRPVTGPPLPSRAPPRRPRPAPVPIRTRPNCCGLAPPVLAAVSGPQSRLHRPPRAGRAHLSPGRSPPSPPPAGSPPPTRPRDRAKAAPQPPTWRRAGASSGAAGSPAAVRGAAGGAQAAAMLVSLRPARGDTALLLPTMPSRAAGGAAARGRCSGRPQQEKTLLAAVGFEPTPPKRLEP